MKTETITASARRIAALFAAALFAEILWPVRSVLLLTVLAVTPVRADVLSLDGNGDYVTFPATGIPSGAASFTIEIWINPTTIPTGGENGGQMAFWGNEAGNQANGFRLRGVAGLRHFFWGNDHDENLGMDILPDTTGPNANGWHHFALTWNGTQTRWYWNGVAIGNPRTAAGVNVVAANHRIGARPGGEFFHGYMDEVRVWNVARSAAEIAAEFQRELNGDEPGLVAYWNFEGNLVDKAGGNNNGTALGNAVVASGLNAPVLPVGPRIYFFTASTNQILFAQSVTLSWAVSNATAVVIDQGIGAVSPSNSIVLTPSATTTYTLTATNLIGVRTAMTTVMVDPGLPVASNFSTNTAYNTPVAITLRGTDPQGSNLTYAIVASPANGSLSGTPPNVTYTPSNNFGGLDSFTFKVNDGVFGSAPATVSINVVPPPLPPSGIVLSTTNIPSGAGPGAFIAALQAIDLNNLYGDSHTFGLVPGYGDNAKFVVSGSSLLAGAAFAGGPGAAFSIRLRATDSTSLSYTQDFALVVFDAPRSIVINEIHYNPDFNPVRESFIELYNDTDAPIDISQWRVRGGVDFFFPSGTTLGARAFAIVAEDPATILSRHGKTAFGPWSGGLNNDGEQLTLRDANSVVIDVVDYRNEFPWPIAPDGNGPSAQLVNAALDNDLGASWRGAAPTPGATNSVFATNVAPHIRQVDHSPNSPRSTNQVLVTCKVTDPSGVAAVALAYQVVAPGSFIPATLPLTAAQLNNLNNVPMTNALNPAFELPANWTTVPMHDDGVNGDALAGDGTYSALLPPQAHRTLVRYRVTCTDTLGASRRAPFEDDPSLNFAYWVYDGIPAYLGFSRDALETLPVYTLVTRAADLDQCTAWFNTADRLTTQTIGNLKNEARFHFNWEGAMVYDGEVYDHITYRLRGANGRYHDGKRSIRYKFKEGRYLAAKDTSGRRFPTKWPELTTGKGQSNRGSETYALQEVVNYFLWNKVGVPAPRTLHFHFRVVRGASEAGADQYSGDFWGLNWAQEKYDASFLESHDLPRGNLYKLIDNLSASLDEQRYQGAFAATNGGDLFNVENNLTGFQSTNWLLAHANYTNWYRYFTVAEAIRHYDTWPSANKNGAYYFEPLYGASNSFLGRMMQLPYDSTDTWGPTWNSGQDILHNGIFNDSGITGGDAGENLELQKEYRNTVRELRALLFQPDQIGSLIDTFAAPLVNVAAADLLRWSNAPAPARYLSLGIAGTPGVTAGLPGVAQDMKNFMFVGGNNAWWIDRTSIGAGGWITRLDTVANDTAIPNLPTITYAGPPGYPQDGLLFQSSAFADPQGAGTFAAMQWRVAEITTTNTPVTDATQLKLEWDAAWDSGELPAFNSQIRFPGYAVQPGHFYRARVRHQDNTGRWSRWSDYIQFIPTPADILGDLRQSLVISEIMYNPPPIGLIDGDEFEFLELKNSGTNNLDLSGLFFSSGITFTFTNGTALAPGATFLLGRNIPALQSRYPGLVVNGLYADKLNNDGETLTLRHPQGFDILSVSYSDSTLVTADGFGFSVVLADAATGTYRASTQAGGSPGATDSPPTVPAVVINEVLTSSALPDVDAIELFNPTATDADLSGWYLTDDAHYPWKYRFADGITLPAGQYLIVTENQFNSTPGLGASFALSSLGDEVYLFSGNTNLQLTGYGHGFRFGGAATGESFGRHVNTTGEEQFPAQFARTPGAANSSPRVGPVVINEIQYNPSTNGDEFVELRNISAGSIQFFDPAAPTNTWRLNGLGYIFPAGVTLPPNQLLLLVTIDPALFRARYSVPGGVQIFGPVPGDFQDNGERLDLQAPDAPTTNGTPYYAVDSIRYNDRAPWPTAADGTGASLQRLVSNAYGDDPINWTAAVSTPGTLLPSGTPPTITGPPSSHSAIAGQTTTLTVSATGGAPLSYQWRFDQNRIVGTTNATLTITNIATSQAGNYTVDVFNRFGSTSSAPASLTVLTPAYITQQPQNLIARAGSNVTFTAAAQSRTPFIYQWRFNGANLPGQTNASLMLTSIQVANDGLYDTVITDAIGPAVSQSARLTVLLTPVIIQPPLSQTVPAGSVVNVSVAITGNPAPFAYQWRSNSLGIGIVTSGARSNFFSFVAPTNPANTTYRIVITNAAHLTPGINTTFVITTLADTDRDGLPDVWETAYGLNPANAGDALLDADGDGLLNGQEYVAGTDPANASSYLKIEHILPTGPATLLFNAVSNRTYTVQFKETLDDAFWQKLADILARPASHIETIVDPSPTPTRLYRLATPTLP